MVFFCISHISGKFLQIISHYLAEKNKKINAGFLYNQDI